MVCGAIAASIRCGRARATPQRCRYRNPPPPYSRGDDRVELGLGTTAATTRQTTSDCTAFLDQSKFVFTAFIASGAISMYIDLRPGTATYVRNSRGHAAPGVSASDVQKMRRSQSGAG
ncbi:MAG TPA: hypothetical protein VKQ31_05925 [Steroidobacteraceae bacterium]|nr:hypothetical protein [Steroidobacteraceae bacterium]